MMRNPLVVGGIVAHPVLLEGKGLLNTAQWQISFPRVQVRQNLVSAARRVSFKGLSFGRRRELTNGSIVCWGAWGVCSDGSGCWKPSSKSSKSSSSSPSSKSSKSSPKASSSPPSSSPSDSLSASGDLEALEDFLRGRPPCSGSGAASDDCVGISVYGTGPLTTASLPGHSNYRTIVDVT